MEDEPLEGNLIEYSWNAGSLPPPYHDEYQIVITSNEAVLTYWPDYPSDQVQSKVYRIGLDENDLDLIVRLLEAIENKEWVRSTLPNLGGENEYLSFNLSGQQNEIPPGLSEQDNEIAQDIYAHVRSLIPDLIWDQIEQIRKMNRDQL